MMLSHPRLKKRQLIYLAIKRMEKNSKELERKLQSFRVFPDSETLYANYIMLPDKRVVRARSFAQWAVFTQMTNRVVKKTALVDSKGNVIELSTVFLGYSLRYGCFETMVFGGDHDQEAERYETYEDALAGHNDMLELLKADIDGNTNTQI